MPTLVLFKMLIAAAPIKQRLIISQVIIVNNQEEILRVTSTISKSIMISTGNSHKKQYICLSIQSVQVNTLSLKW